VLRGGAPQRQTGDHQAEQNHQYTEDDWKIARTHAGRSADIQCLTVDKEACANGHDNQAAENISRFLHQCHCCVLPCLFFQDCGLAGQKGFITEARQRRSRISERCAPRQAAHGSLI
jgi:hypothetical protein